MDEEEPNHPVFSYSEEGEEENPAVNDELENLSDDIRRKHDSKTSYGRANAGGAIGFRGGPDVLNENDKIQLAMRTSEATSGPGAVLHAPDENSTSRVKRTQSTQLAFFSLFRRDPDGCRGPARHKEDDKSRKNDFDNTNSVEQEPLDDLNSRMNIFKRHNDGLEGTEEQKRKRRRTIFILFGVVGLLVIVSVVVGVVMGMGGQGKSPTTADDADVDFVESVVECLAAGVEYEASERFTRIQSTIVSEIAGMNTTIELPGTAARAALCWLADLDIAEFSTSEASPRGIIQRFALGLIYYHFVLGVDSEPGSKLVTSNWLQAVHECRWDYVDCAGESVGEVVELRMSSLLLSGAMPSELGLLTTLSTLELGANFLVGTMPSELWTMERLETFSVQANRMSGTLSSQVRQLSRLRSFDVSLNAFSGTIPDLGDFPTLERFDVFSNPLIVGMIPNLEGATNLGKGICHDCVSVVSFFF